MKGYKKMDLNIDDFVQNQLDQINSNIAAIDLTQSIPYYKSSKAGEPHTIAANLKHFDRHVTYATQNTIN